LWVFFVIFFFLFIFSVIFMHGATDYFKSEDLNSDEVLAIKDLFGDMLSAMLTLFESITGGRDWHEVVVALTHMHWTYGWMFLSYIFFMTFLVLNVVVAQVVKTTSEVYKRDRDMIVQEEQLKVQLYCGQLKGFFRDADADGSGTLSWDEFSEYLHHDKVQAYFQSLDLDISQAHLFFKLLDKNQDGEVAIDEFLDGCMDLKGQARTIDVRYLMHEHRERLDAMADAFAIAMGTSSE